MEATNSALILPIAVVSPTDVARLVKELDSLDEYFRQEELRSRAAPVSAPRYSRLLDEVVVANKLNLLQSAERNKLLDSFRFLVEKAPVLHISFSVDPPGPYVQKIVDWLRHNIEPTILIRVGLQPNIGAGCVVRTTNKSFDFSLRKFFESKHEFFMEKLHEVLTPEETVDPMFDSQATVEEVVTESSEGNPIRTVDIAVKPIALDDSHTAKLQVKSNLVDETHQVVEANTEDTSDDRSTIARSIPVTSQVEETEVTS